VYAELAKIASGITEKELKKIKKSKVDGVLSSIENH
jgi:hypothetical protein